MAMPPSLAKGYEHVRRLRILKEVESYRAPTSRQQPETMVIAYADRRVDLASIFHASPGELFVARNVAALVPRCEAIGSCHGTSAAIEFAVTGLTVKPIVILGHSRCGGVAAGPEPNSPRADRTAAF